VPFDLPIFLAMLVLGGVLGFVGLGGAGFIAAVMIIGFRIPVHLAFGTALGAMFVASLAGSWSHLREGNCDLVVGLQTGLAGALAAYLGSSLALATGASELKALAGAVLAGAAIAFWLRERVTRAIRPARRQSERVKFAGSLGSIAVGLACGLASGFLSIGVSPWIQVGLLIAHRFELRRAVGTGMLAMGFMSLAGAIGFAGGGQQDLTLLVSVILGISAGAYLGAKLTRRVPTGVLRAAIVITPMTAGTLLILAPAG